MTFAVERRPLPETETERARARHAAAEAARARVPAPRRRFSLAGVAPRGFVSANLSGGGRKCRSASAEKLRLNHDPGAVLEVVAAALPKPKEIARTPELKGARAAPWHERMVGWLGELVDPVPAVIAEVKKGTALKPLKVGMHKELKLRPGINPKRVGTWVNGWCNSLSYVEAVAAPGSMRHDLEGRPVEPVSAEDRQNAAERLPELRREAAERIAAKKAEQSKPVVAHQEDLVVVEKAEPVAQEDREEDLVVAENRDAINAEEDQWCRECLNVGDLQDGLCVVCRVVAGPATDNILDLAERAIDVLAREIREFADPLIGGESTPAEQAAAAVWYCETLRVAKSRREATARRRAAGRKQRSA